jgi:hypothetical protein
VISAGAYVVSVLALIAVGLAIGFTAYRLRQKLLPDWQGAPARLVEIVTALAALIWLGELLGTFGLFYEWTFVAASLLVAAIAGALLPAGPVTAGDPPPPAVAKASSGAGPPTAPPAGVTFGIAFVLTAIVLLAWPAVDPGLSTLYDRTIAYQAGRDSPFSIWGQIAWLEPVRIALLAAVALLAIAFAFRPKEKQLFQVAALGAALLIGLQLTMHHWFYLYIVWFYPLLLVALASLDAPSSRRELLEGSRHHHLLDRVG